MAVITDFIIPSIELPIEMDFIFDNCARPLVRDGNVETFPLFIIGSLCHFDSISNFVRPGNFPWQAAEKHPFAVRGLRTNGVLLDLIIFRSTELVEV